MKISSPLFVKCNFVSIAMCYSINLNNQFFVVAKEVRNEWTDRLLPVELESIEVAVSQTPPKTGFCFGLVVAQIASAFESL
jgi:hypothetical protein